MTVAADPDTSAWAGRKRASGEATLAKLRRAV